MLGFVLAAVAAGAVGAAAGDSATSDTIARVRLASLEANTRLWYVEDVVPAAAGRPWTVVGYLVNAVGKRTPSAWSSPDGVRWTRTTLPASPSPGRNGVFEAAGYGDTIAAFGLMNVGTGNRLVGWTNRDNVWSFASDLERQYAGRQDSIEAVAAGPDGFVAVGNEITADTSRAIVLESQDGRSWRSIEQPDFNAPPGSAMLMQDVEVGAGRALALARFVPRTHVGPPSELAAYVREDGHWSRIAPKAFGSLPPFLHDAVPAGAGFVAVGERRIGERFVATSWVSADGHGWRRSSPSAFVVRGRYDSAVGWVGRAGNAHLAIGHVDQVPAAWLSGDGLRWVEIPLPAAISRFGVPTRASLASSRGTLVLALHKDTGGQLWRFADRRWQNVGRGSAFPSRAAAVEVNGVAFSRGRAAAVGNASDRGRGTARVWFFNRTSWHAGHFPNASAATLISIAGTPRGFVAGGLTARGSRFSPALWSSTDGRAWHRERLPSLPAGTDGAVQAVVNDGPQIVAVVNEVVHRPAFRKRISLFTSHDARTWRRAGTVASGALAARAVCVSGESVLVVGLTRVGRVDRGTVWERVAGAWRRALLDRGSVAEACALQGGSAVVVGAEAGNGAAWLRDARGWTRVRGRDLSLTAPARVLSAVVSDPDGTGFVAAGGEGARGEYDVGVWTSLDGRSWQALRNGDDALQEPGYQQASSVAVDGRNRIILGGVSVGSGGLWQGASPAP